MPKASGSNTNAPPSPPLRKVAECLYRNESSGTYYALVKRSGKQYRRSLKTTDRKVADRFLGEFRNKVDKLSRTTTASRVTVSEISEHWLNSLRAHLKPSSFGRKQTSVIKINALIGSMTLRQITSHVCEEWSKRRGKGIAASTYNNERDTLRAILEYAKKEGLILDNPASALPRRKLPKRSPKAPTLTQFTALIAQLRGKDIRCEESANLLELLAYSGMRLAEATSMHWSDIDTENGRFIVTGGETGTKNHEERQVPLFPSLRAFLDRLRKSHHPERTDLIIRIKSARKAMDHACRKADLPEFTHHSLRHYFCTNAVEFGVDFKTIAAWVGHKDGGLLVAKTYGHLRDTHSYKMAELMDYSAASTDAN